VTDGRPIVISALAAEQIRAGVHWWRVNRSKAPDAFSPSGGQAAEQTCLSDSFSRTSPCTGAFERMSLECHWHSYLGFESNIAPNHLCGQQLRKSAKDSNCWATVEELCNGWVSGIRTRLACRWMSASRRDMKCHVPVHAGADSGK
jgi:hypothetical protein